MNFAETYDFLVSIIANSPYGIIAVDLDGYVTMCNEKALINLNIPDKLSDVVEQPLINYLQHAPDFAETLMSQLEENNYNFNLTTRVEQKRYVAIQARQIMSGMVITISDITKRQEVEKNMLRAMIRGQEKERRRLAQEMHDGIGPLLSTLKLHIEELKNKPLNDHSELEHQCDELIGLLQTVTTEIRNISHALMPHALVDFGLATALESMCAKANQTSQVTVNFYKHGMEERLDQHLEFPLYRIGQELLNNALKHAKATTINMQLIRHSDHLLLMVEDNGVGFKKSSATDGIGLKNLQTRAKSIGATFTLDTQPNRGVLATIEVPM